MSDQAPTQGSQAEANGSEGSEHQAPQTIPVERFNEIYREQQDGKRLLVEMQAALAQSQATIATLQTQRAAPQEEVPQIDPDDQKKVSWLVAQAMQPVLQELKTLKAGVGRAQNDPQVAEVERQLVAINNPAITVETRKLMESLRQRGELGSLYTPAEVLNQAIGKVMTAQLVQGGQSQNERAQYNANGQPLVQGGAGGGRRAPVQQPAAAARGKDMEDMSVDELAASLSEMEKKNPAGFSF